MWEISNKVNPECEDQMIWETTSLFSIHYKNAHQFMRPYDEIKSLDQLDIKGYHWWGKILANNRCFPKSSFFTHLMKEYCPKVFNFHKQTLVCPDYSYWYGCQ